MDEVNRVKEGRQPERQLVSEKADVHSKESTKSAAKEAKKEDKSDAKKSEKSKEAKKDTSKPAETSNVAVQTDL